MIFKMKFKIKNKKLAERSSRIVRGGGFYGLRIYIYKKKKVGIFNFVLGWFGGLGAGVLFIPWLFFLKSR